MLIIKTFILLFLHISNAEDETLIEEEAEVKEEAEEKEYRLEEEALEQYLEENKNPHIVFILADDLGWNDVSFHGSPQIPTPNIDALAANSIILNSYYTENNCAQSRASLMSGLYPIHLGLQHSQISSGKVAALPLDVKILPEYLKDKNYLTYMVGKWNLGYFKKEFTPNNRGFDSFYGFYNEQIDYFDFTNYQKYGETMNKLFYGVDLQDNATPVKNMRGRYATEVFTEKAVNFIENHNESFPLFLYMAHLAPHTGNDYMPLQAPLRLIYKNAQIQDPKRRIYAGMISALDESIGKTVEALSKRGFLNNTIIIFASDNGGLNKESNWPFRGLKRGPWEGGIRVPCFIWSPLLGLKEPRTTYNLMHVTDWLPTVYSAAGGDVKELGKIDGYNMWKDLIANTPTSRIEILHNIDPISKTSVLRRGDYKLIDGTESGGNDLWYGTDINKELYQPSSMDEWIFKNGSLAKEIFQNSNIWLVKTPDSWRNNTSVTCKQPPPSGNGGCDPNEAPCLFNVAADPCEYNNLASQYPRIVKSMMKIISNYNETAVEPLLNSTDPRGDPKCHGFSYVPWLDEEYNLDCSYLGI
ncbi:arylsulfatase B [Parasteatoda tepidariorum]|uniref:arylsulfatase B n=1 Tax=Parasteatoda tepidariorum TaxID=114398 RepID=UPI00077FC976|nr:arylsulfatase B [Parasteatoda tepidariorum]